MPVRFECRDHACACANERVENNIALVRKCEYAALCEFMWKLARMNRQFGVVCLDIGDVPYRFGIKGVGCRKSPKIGRVLSKGIATRFPGFIAPLPTSPSYSSHARDSLAGVA